MLLLLSCRSLAVSVYSYVFLFLICTQFDCDHSIEPFQWSDGISHWLQEIAEHLNRKYENRKKRPAIRKYRNSFASCTRNIIQHFAHNLPEQLNGNELESMRNVHYLKIVQFKWKYFSHGGYLNGYNDHILWGR